jgi:hypothetical protein
MRTSGRGKSETLMYIAPAAIFGGFLLLMSGTPHDAVVALDRFLVKILDAAIGVAAAVVHAIS